MENQIVLEKFIKMCGVDLLNRKKFNLTLKNRENIQIKKG
jgi:hypothetical protein